MSDTRTRILQACQAIIARDGVRRFRMQEVAREAGVSIGLLSYHFGDRDGLLQAALDRVNAGTEDRARLSRDRGAATRLHDLLTSEFGNGPGVRDGSVVWNELRANAVFEPAQAAALTRSTEHWQRSVAELIAEAAPASGPAAHRTALLLTSLVEGLSGRWLTGQITVDEARRAVDDALAALGLTAS